MRRQFVLFGSSIVQYSFHHGWGANLAHLYARKADIFLRGYTGWNSRRALKVVDTIFPKFAPKQPDLVIVYFGGNDSTFPHESGYGPHVPLEEYKDNIRKIAQHLKELKTTRIIFLTPPPIDDEKVKNYSPRSPSEVEKSKNSSGESEKPTKTNEECGKYAKACKEVCNEENVTVINLWEIIQAITNWQNDCISDDGVHLTPKGNEVVSNEILKVLKDADWKPSLHYDDLPADFGDDSPYDPVILHHKTINISHAPYPYPPLSKM